MVMLFSGIKCGTDSTSGSHLRRDRPSESPLMTSHEGLSREAPDCFVHHPHNTSFPFDQNVNGRFGCGKQWFLDAIRDEEYLELVGVHSHLGSTIKKVRCWRGLLSRPLSRPPPLWSTGPHTKQSKLRASLFGSESLRYIRQDVTQTPSCRFQQSTFSVAFQV